MKTRRANLKDVEPVSNIVCSCYENYEHTDSWPAEIISQIKTQRGMDEHIRILIQHQTMYVVDDGEQVLGMISIHVNEVTKLFVHPNFQRRGVGRVLFQIAEEHIKASKHEQLILGTAAPSSIPFYKKMGMHIVERRDIDCGPCIGMTSTLLAKGLA